MTFIPNIQRLSFNTSHFQFYLVDPDVKFDTGTQSFWTNEASQRTLAVGPGVLGIGTSSYGRVRCFFEVAQREPTWSSTPWDRIVEASITLTNGRYAIQNCDEAKMIVEGNLPAGDYRLRVHAAFTDEYTPGSNEEYFDFYWLVLWPQEFSEPRVLKSDAST